MNFLNLAKQLINDATSCVTKINHTVTIALQPSYIDKEAQGVAQFLQGWKNHYVKRLGGIVLGYDGVMFLEEDGEILSDLPYIYHQVSADFYVFKPIIGNILFGTVNKISQTHAGCLVHGCINVSLTLDKGIDEATIDNFVCIGQEMAFKITSVDSGENNMRIRGRITHECLQILKDRPISSCKPQESKVVNGYTVNESDNQDSEDEFFTEPITPTQNSQKLIGSEEPSIKTTPKRKRKRSDSFASTNTSGIFSPTSKSPHKKRKSLKEAKSSKETPILYDSGVESIAANNDTTKSKNSNALPSPKRGKKRKKSEVNEKSIKSSDVEMEEDEYGLKFDPAELQSLIQDMELTPTTSSTKKKRTKKRSKWEDIESTLTEGHSSELSSTIPDKKNKRKEHKKKKKKKRKEPKDDDKKRRKSSTKSSTMPEMLSKKKKHNFHKSK